MEQLYHSGTGERLYLNAEERSRFLLAAAGFENDLQYYALMIYYTGCRLSEALNLQLEHIDFDNESVIIRSLKKRGKIHYRHIPLPENYLKGLASAYNLHKLKKNKDNRSKRLWNFTDRTARRYIKTIMDKAELTGKKACAKGLRHAFGIACVENNIPLTEIQQLMGHSFLRNTAIYTTVQGAERRNLVSRLW
jgi:integrase